MVLYLVKHTDNFGLTFSINKLTVPWRHLFISVKKGTVKFNC